ncbi:hypothetical protein ACQP1P_26430 [Dactylosporangium sp. CA-052675]|uniref:hypothetical protein n=1 Tax=Dactylosporangium sp. CA-052675 TaxID=3239927 RepID=UPI003D8DBE11
MKPANSADLLDPARPEEPPEVPAARRRQAPAADPQPPDGDSPGGGGGLVRVTVNLTPKAYEALQRTCEATRDTKTDAINRALLVYELVQRLADQGGGSITMVNSEGEKERIHIL